MILGQTGSGKSFLLNFLITNLQKYDPYTFIFDLGGSFESLTQLFGDAYVRVGMHSPDFKINPFSLPATKQDFDFLALFVKVLAEADGPERLTSDEEQDLYQQIENLYEIHPEMQTLGTLVNTLPRNLSRRLEKWTAGGQFGFLFDNPEDTITFSHFQCFDFQGMSQYPDLLEPLLFYILHLANEVIANREITDVFKAFFIDEAWMFFRNPAVKSYIIEALKTWRKQNAAIFIIGNILTGFMNLYGGKPIPISQQASLLPALFCDRGFRLCPIQSPHAHQPHLQRQFGGLCRQHAQLSQSHEVVIELMAGKPVMNEAKQRYMEQYGDTLVTNAYLKIALELLSLAVVGLVILNVRTIYIFRNFKPLVIRIDKLGRAQAVSYDSFAYKPQAKESRYFLIQFCQLYYRRNRYTINDDFTKALYFLDGKLANDILTQYKKNKTIQNFLDDPSALEVDIDVEQVAIVPMIKPPYRASVDFYKVEYSPVDHSVLKRTLCTASFVFAFRNPVPNRLIPINPLGLTILDFREDEAFTTKPNQE